MDQFTAIRSLARQWRALCERHWARLAGLDGLPTPPRRVLRLEEGWIGQLHQAELSVQARAVAFRQIVELRGCSARDVGTFFAVEPQIIIAGLSLLALDQCEDVADLIGSEATQGLLNQPKATWSHASDAPVA